MPRPLPPLSPLAMGQDRWKIRRLRSVFGEYRWWVLPPANIYRPVRSYPDFETARAAFARGRAEGSG